MSTNIAPIDPMTNEQAGRAADRFQALCRKEGLILPKETVQVVLEEEGEELSADMFNALRLRVERRAKTIIRHIRVDRFLTHQQALDATGRKQYVNQEVLATASKGSGEGVYLCFFDLDYDPTVDELDREMEKRGLKSDIDALAAFNAANPDFADDRPNATQWRDAGGKACCAIFRRRYVLRKVDVDRYVFRWHRDYRFAGVRK